MRRGLGVGLAALLLACAREQAEPAAPPARPGAPDAIHELAEELALDRGRPRHASDGGGRAWLEQRPPGGARVGTPGRVVLAYEAGPLGIAVGGALRFQVPPNWGWSTPQVEAADAPGYSVVTSEAAGVVLAAETLDLGLLALRIWGRALVAGVSTRTRSGYPVALGDAPLLDECGHL